MKRIFSAALLICFFSLSVEAGIDANFKVPSRIYSIDELGEAIAEAKEDGEPITYFYGNPQSTCPLHNRDAELALKEAKRFSVVVLLPTTRDDRFDKVSPLVMTALRSDKAGNIIPKLATASPEGTEIIALMPNKNMDQRGAFREYRKLVEAGNPVNFGGTATRPVLNWYVKDKPGSHYEASFVALEGDTLKLKRLDDGLVFKVSINEFTDAVANYARTIDKQIKATEEAAKPKVQHPIETWNSSDGRELKGRFINLEGDDITLHLEAGNEVIFKTNLLSPSSLERARKLSNQ